MIRTKQKKLGPSAYEVFVPFLSLCRGFWTSTVHLRGKAGSVLAKLIHLVLKLQGQYLCFKFVLDSNWFQQIRVTAKVNDFIFCNFISPLFTWVPLNMRKKTY